MDRKTELNPQLVGEHNIDSYKQNKTSYIADDYKKLGIPYETSMNILLARGVCKWFSVRRKLIRFKIEMKKMITCCDATLKDLKQISSTIDNKTNEYRNHRKNIYKLVGYRMAMEDMRNEIRNMCHSKRWQAPDFDFHANKFLKWKEESN